jgi:tRNA modification GTPase
MRAGDPIVAVATAPGRAAVGVVRASGTDLHPLMLAVCGRSLQPRMATLLPFLDAEGRAVDRGLALYFPAPNSYTGEDVLELQAHGGPVVMQLLLARCLQAMPGLRLASPGEFTERAFLNGKLDLAQAEAVADLIDASTEAAARSAARSLSGTFSADMKALAQDIVQLRMLVEATLDFPEEEIDFLEKAGARGQLQSLLQRVDAARAQARQGALLREGLRVVLAGQPNVGKSALLNALAGAELAIVTAIPGTTRDRISETLQIDGVPIHLTDTAGLRPGGEAADEVERIGIGRSWQAIEQADAVLFLHDLSRHTFPDYAIAEAEIGRTLPRHVPVLHVFNKVDLPGVVEPGHGLAISAMTGRGVPLLRQAILGLAGVQDGGAENATIARARHVHALAQARDHLLAASVHAAAQDGALDLLAEELRQAHRHVGEVTGEFTNDDLLGEIFSRFCIGK